MANVIFPIHLSADAPFRVMQIANFQFAPNFQAKGNMPRCEWYYCLSGLGQITIGDNRYDFQPGMMFSNKANVYREIIGSGESPLNAMMLGLDGTDMDSMMRRAMGGADRVLTPTNGEAIVSIISQMHDIAATFSPLSREIVNHYLPVLLETIREGRFSDANEVGGGFEIYHRCKKTIDEDYAHLLQVDEVAEKNNISHEYMCRLFKEFTTYTPNEYLQLKKMNSALHALQHHNESIKSIAYRHGYATASAFSKAFKRVMGRSPKQLRDVNP